MFGDLEPLIEAGCALHWLQPRTKRPIDHDWSNKPVRTAAQLRASHQVGANLGVRLGEPSRVFGEYLHVFDVDVRDAAFEGEAFAKLHEIYPGYDRLPTVQSGSAGASRHLYFTSERPFRSRKLVHSVEKWVDSTGRSHWAYEIELFGTGKQIVLPPSIHPDTGKPYAWIKPFDFEAMELGCGPSIPANTVASWAPKVFATAAAEDDDDLLGLVRSAPADVTDEQIRDTLARLPLAEWCEDRDGWFKVGMALHNQFEGGEEGYDLWVGFSSQSDKFNAKDQRRVWESFRLTPNGVRFPTLLMAAKEERLRRTAQADLVLAATDRRGSGGRLDAIAQAGKAGLMFDKDKAGDKILPTAANLSVALCSPAFLGMDIRFDEFKSDIVWTRPTATEWRRLEDSDYFEVRLRLERSGFKPLGRELVRDAVKHHARSYPIDTATMWVDRLSWDGVARIETFWIDYFGVADTPYSRACGRYVWTALAGRLLQPGCQADMVPILTGPQGVRSPAMLSP